MVFKLAQRMEESGRAQTDAAGLFHFKLKDPPAVHLVRVIHQGVSYHRMAPPGAASVAIEVYDVARKVDGVKVFADIMRVRSVDGQIAVTREFAVQNTSNPPRTQMSEHNLEFYVPDHARVIVDSATATIETGIPLKSAPESENEKNRYSFLFPLRPGLTRFAVTYQLPYSGRTNLDPRTIYPLEHFVVTLPKGMRFNIVREMLALLRVEASRCSIVTNSELAPELPNITADRVQLQQVFMNLMLNAIEAMKNAGGELTIKTELDQEGRLMISVRDTGVGLPAEKTEEIFKAMASAERGLGFPSLHRPHGQTRLECAQSGLNVDN